MQASSCCIRRHTHQCNINPSASIPIITAAAAAADITPMISFIYFFSQQLVSQQMMKKMQ